MRADVLDAKDVKTLVDEAVSTYGRLDYAINNAGIKGVLAPTANSSMGPGTGCW